MILTAWDTNNANAEAQKLPTRIGMVDMSKNNILTKEQAKVKLELVWVDTTVGTNASKYYKIFGITPIYHTILIAERNNMKLKYMIMGKKIWKSLKSGFQIEILGSNHEFKRG